MPPPQASIAEAPNSRGRTRRRPLLKVRQRPSSSSFKISANPVIDVRNVRISWLVVATIADVGRLASSAFTLCLPHGVFVALLLGNVLDHANHVPALLLLVARYDQPFPEHLPAVPHVALPHLVPGILLLNRGGMTFDAHRPHKSGIFAPGDVRGLLHVPTPDGPLVVVGNNDGPLDLLTMQVPPSEVATR